MSTVPLRLRHLIAGLAVLCGVAAAPATASETATAPVVFKEYVLASPKPNLAKIKANKIEKPVLKFGIIKLTDCVPIVAARELGFFAEEGLSVSIEVQANWKVLLENTVAGTLDGAHMLAGQPIGATIGYLGQADMMTPFSMDLNGNAATVSNKLWAQMQEREPRLKEPGHAHPVTANALLPIAKERAAAGNPLRFAMVFPVSCHNYELRYWLAAGGVNPGFYDGYNDPVGKRDADVLLSVTPPPQMVQTLTQNTIDGYCVGEPWNQQAVRDGVGVPVFTDYYIWKNNPEKVFGFTQLFSSANPNTVIAVTKALIRAGHWLDASRENRITAVEMLANKAYIGANPEVLGASMLGTFEFQKGDKRDLPDFNVFYRYNATYPLKAHCVWYLTQMRRWGQIPTTKSDSWYHETAGKIYRPDIYRTAFAKLLEEKLIPEATLPTDDLPAFPADDFIDKIAFDSKQPNAYLKSLPIGLK